MTTQTNRQVELHAPEEIRIIDSPRPTPGPPSYSST